jgi:hypothetical protein
MQKQLFVLISVVIVAVLFLNSCKEDTEPTGPSARITRATIAGTVRDSRNGSPLSGANVNLALLSKGIDVTKTTGTSGGFTFTVDLGDTLSASATLTITKSGYKDKVSDVSLIPGKSTTLPDFTVERDTTTGIGGGGGGTGGTTYANTIAFISAVPTQLSVRGVGGNETSIITFEARDSFGIAIDFDHKDTISLKLFGSPVSGGAYVSPSRVLTNASGRIATTVNSGTQSGPLQIVATMKRRGFADTITSQPARLIVSGGLPDQRYFSIAARPVNIAGLFLNGETSSIEVLVGDRFGNPVPAGTAVYFHTNIGVITTNTGFTDENGYAQVTLFSGNPRGGADAKDSVFGRTIGENGAVVQGNLQMLFSGPPDTIKVIGTPADTISAGECNSIFIKVSDINGNPIVGGSTITPTLQTESEVTVSPSSYRVPDSQTSGPGGTDFLFTICDVLEDPAPVGGAVTIYINVVWKGSTYTKHIKDFYIR